MKDLALNPIVTSSISALLILFFIFIGNPQISSITTSKKSEAVTLAKHAKQESLQPNPSKVSSANQPWTTHFGEGFKLDHINSQQFEQDDLISLFQTMEEGVDKGVHTPYVTTEASLRDDKKVVEAFADLETSMKITLNEIANSDENRHRLESALNFLSTYFSKEPTHSHGLKVTIDSLHQEIQSILSSFKQASATIHKFTELEEKEKGINEELCQRKEAAISLLSEIYETEKSMSAAQQQEAELKEQISRLQAEFNNKEKEIQDYKIKVSSLQEQKKKSVSDTMGFMKEFEIVKKDRSQMMENQIRAKKELEKLASKWSSCAADLKKILHNF